MPLIEVHMNIILTGMQGSGKGTQAAMLTKAFTLKHISTGDVLRKHITNKTEFGIAYEAAYNKGGMAPDNIIFDIIKYETTNLDGYNGYILDGFPRNHNQCVWVYDNLDVDFIVRLDVPRDQAIAWAMSRGRSDDTMDALNNRINTYLSETKPAIDGLCNNYAISFNVDGTHDIDSVHNTILSELSIYLDR